MTHAISAHFPLGSVGGSGRQSQRLNTRRSRSLDGHVQRATQTIATENRIRGLQRRLAVLRGEAAELPAAVIARARQAPKREKT